MPIHHGVLVDGSEGEGGGQLLRTSLALSVVTGLPFEMVNIRAKRPNPGLQAQHLQALLAAQQICGATVEGASKGSLSVRFMPGPPHGGQYRFDIDTAGATSLVLHTVYLPLLHCTQPSTVRISGGTHVAWSPTFNHLVGAWLPCLRAMGGAIDLTLRRAGFYPEGGGEIVARIEPAAALHPLRLETRGPLREVSVYSASTNLPDDVVGRQTRTAQRLLQEAGLQPEVEQVHVPSRSRNTICAITGVFQHTQVCYTALGERGKRAERVAEEACGAFLAFLHTEATVDEYLADQLVLPLALARGPSRFRTPRITSHLLTNIATIRKFLAVEVRLSGVLGSQGDVDVLPTSSR
jgi:RNA 3'-terminal phosphate cyclase (ATP)